MKIKVLSSKGIHPREVKGIDAFQKRLPQQWYGFANLELIQRTERARQIDVALVIQDRILLVDLKDWKGEIRSDGQTWYRDAKNMEGSPVKKIDENARVIATELRAYLSGAVKLGPGERPSVPFVQGCVVLTGRGKVVDMPQGEQRKVFYLDDFCRALSSSDKREYYKLLDEVPYVDVKNPLTEVGGSWRSLLNAFFSPGDRFRPTEVTYADYRPSSAATFLHSDSLYEEYDAEEIGGARSSGLLRLWDFQKAPARFLAEDARLDVVSREREVQSYLLDRSPELETVLLRAKAQGQDADVRHWEVFEKRRQLRRMGDFVRSNDDRLTPKNRKDLVRVLLAHMATVHSLGVAHLDLGQHSVWLELPNSVRLSHLLAAHYPALRTLGEDRYSFLGNRTVLPETVLGESATPFQRDIFLLGVVSHEILLGKPPRNGGDGNPPDWDPAADEADAMAGLHGWLAQALSFEPSKRFADAQAMLDAFNGATSEQAIHSAAYERLGRRLSWNSPLALIRDYPVTEVLREDSRLFSYRSSRPDGTFLVKSWTAAHLGDTRLEAGRLLAFLDRADELARTPVARLCRPVRAGMAGDGLALVQEHISAPNLETDLRANPGRWSEPAAVLGFLLILCEALEELHGQGHFHGDVSPANILVTPGDDGESSPVLVDLVDLAAVGEGELRTPAYSPAFPADAAERDRFGALKICEDMFSPLGDFQGREKLAQAILECRDGPPRLASLAPLVDALRGALEPAEAVAGMRLTVTLPREVTRSLTPDDGMFKVVPERSANLSSRLLVVGASDELVVELDPVTGVSSAFARQLRQSELHWRDRKSIAEFRGSIEVIGGQSRDLSGLLPLLDLPEVVVWRSASPAPGQASTGPDEPQAKTLAVEVRDNEALGLSQEDVDNGAEKAASKPSALADVAGLWRTFLKVEAEQATTAVAEDDSQYLKRNRRHQVGYAMSAGVLDYQADEPVMVEVRTATGWRRAGMLDVQRTGPSVLSIDASSTRGEEGGTLVKAGAELRFVGIRDADSFSRRQSATDVILSDRAGIRDLQRYFAAEMPASEPPAAGAHRRVPVGADELAARYDLNPTQASALAETWGARPLGLLQGPPGTGKTTFIAALVHHALTRGGIRNVLLASQSHEAVNTVAEEVLKLFRKLGDEPSLIRIGQEGQVSDYLRPVHSARIEASYRERFRSRLKQKFELVGRAIGAPAGLVDDVFFIETTLRPMAWAAEGRDTSAAGESATAGESLAATAARLLDERGMPGLADGEPFDTDAINRIVATVAGRIPAATPDHARRLMDTAELSRDWLNSVSSRRRNFEAFLVGTRQIVAGTCVGLGRSSLAPAPGSFDLVVIDEAARCTASELAVPMQAGKWAVLVGDQAQLEPHHEPGILEEVAQRTGNEVADLRRSDFERAFMSPYGQGIGQKLLIQYRMLPPIGRLVSRASYGGQLQHGRTEPDIPAECLPPGFDQPLSWLDTSVQGASAFQRKGGRGDRSLVNEAEAAAIVKLVELLGSHGPFREWAKSTDPDLKPIGIICMYSAQRDLVRRQIALARLSDDIRQSCKVETVDSYQGKQNPIIILSLVRNNEAGRFEDGVRTIAEGFMSKLNRLNVAMSRARDRLVIVGNMNRWPRDSSMNRVASLVRKQAEEGDASIVAQR
jgi:serine/threonine protein kinase